MANNTSFLYNDPGLLLLLLLALLRSFQPQVCDHSNPREGVPGLCLRKALVIWEQGPSGTRLSFLPPSFKSMVAATLAHLIAGGFVEKVKHHLAAPWGERGKGGEGGGEEERRLERSFVS